MEPGTLRVPVRASSILARGVKANTPGWRLGNYASPTQPAAADSVAAAFRARMAGEQEQDDLRWLRQVSPGSVANTFGPSPRCGVLVVILRCPEPLEELSCAHPFAHRPLVEYMLTIPASVVCGPGRPRSLMRRALAGLVPAPILARRSKSAYNGAFLEALRPLAWQMLEESPRLQVVQRGFIEPASLEARLRLLTQRLECNEPQLRRVILLEFWLRNRERRDANRSASAAAR